MGENGPVNENRDNMKHHSTENDATKVHWLVSLYDLRRPIRQCKNSSVVILSHTSQGIFKGATSRHVPQPKIRIQDLQDRMTKQKIMIQDLQDPTAITRNQNPGSHNEAKI